MSTHRAVSHCNKIGVCGPSLNCCCAPLRVCRPNRPNKMPGGQGLRHRTRDLFQRGFRQKGFISLTTYLRTYQLGDYVDIKMNPAQQKVGFLTQ